MLELSLEERCEVPDCSPSLVFAYQSIHKVYSGNIIQEMQEPSVTVVPPCELLQVDCSKCWLAAVVLSLVSLSQRNDFVALCTGT